MLESFKTYIPNKNIVITISIVIIILILYTIISTYYIYHVGYHMLGGFWSADPSFCEDSGLDRFYIFIEPPNKGNICWICMSNSDTTVVNNITTYSIKTKWNSVDNWTTDIKRPRTFKITFDNLPKNLTKDIFPKKQILKLDIETGKIYLMDRRYNNNKVYFVGYKDSRISDLIDVNNNNQKKKNDISKTSDEIFSNSEEESNSSELNSKEELNSDDSEI